MRWTEIRSDKQEEEGMNRNRKRCKEEEEMNRNINR
jgi:hypothetical protein